MADTSNATSELKYGVGQHAVSIGTSCWVRIGSTADNAKTVGMIDSMRATKNIQLQRAQVCGAIMPASIDPQSISVTLNLSGFLAVPAMYKEGVTINGAGTYSLESFNPDSDDFVEGKVPTKFDYMDFYDKHTGKILAWFTDVIPSSFGISINGGSYVKADISAEALYMSSGDEYLEQN